jgi:hypothetical protein
MTIRQQLVSFARETLGCGCPDEVFSQLVYRVRTRGDGAEIRLEVGGRLMIVVVEDLRLIEDPRALAALVERGLRERDERGFNRLRVVVARTGAALDEAGIVRELQGLGVTDDKTHLHFVAAGEVPW